MKNYHLITIRYYGPTNFKGSRVALISKRFGEHVVLGYDYQVGDMVKQAEAWLAGKGFSIVGGGEYGDDHIIITDTFKSLKEALR